ncbi:MAG TPA: VTT domain-containing protein [Patescibacteria group bacterium]
MKKNKIIFGLTFQWILMLLLSLAIILLAAKYHLLLSHFKSWGLFGIFVINALSTATIFMPTPGFATVIAGGGLYPPIFVALVASLGSGLGDLTSYILGFSSNKVLIKKEHKRYEKLILIFEKYGAVIIFILALIPNPIFDALGIISGILKYPVEKFFLWVFLGRLIRNLLLAFFGLSLSLW